MFELVGGSFVMKGATLPSLTHTRSHIKIFLFHLNTMTLLCLGTELKYKDEYTQ